MTDQTCAGCKFYDESLGACRRYPPRILDYGHGTDVQGIWPTVNDDRDDWCGEFKPREDDANRGEQVEALQQLLDECAVAAGSAGLLWRELPNAIREMSKAAPAPDDWRPIETAPRGGMLILLWVPQMGAERELNVGWLDAVQGWCIDGASGLKPTHWMLRPEPPTAGDA